MKKMKKKYVKTKLFLVISKEKRNFALQNGMVDEAISDFPCEIIHK